MIRCRHVLWVSFGRVTLPGTIAIVDDRPPVLSSRQGRILQTKYRVSVDGTVFSETVGLPGQVKVDAGVHAVRVSVNGLPTNKVTIIVSEGARHAVRVTPTRLGHVTVFFGLIGVLIARAWPGFCWRAEHIQS